MLKNKLPVGGYRDLNKREIAEIYNNGNIDLSRYGDEKGAFLTVNMRCPTDESWQKYHR
jgi:hypothetical protein